MSCIVFLVALLLSLPQFLSLSLSADEVSYSLVYDGGKIMTRPLTVSLLWVGDGWTAVGQSSLLNAIASLTPPSLSPTSDSGVPTLSDWWKILRQYLDGSHHPVTDQVRLGPQCYYTGTQTNMTLEKVTHIARSAFDKSLNCTGSFNIDDDTIHLMIFSHNVVFVDGEEQLALIDHCSGELDVDVPSAAMAKLWWVSEPLRADDRCSRIMSSKIYMGPANGDERTDSLIGNVLGTLAEAATNGDGRGWSTGGASESRGLGVSGVCEAILREGIGETPLFMDEERMVSFNVVGEKGYRYMVQYLWDQRIGNCALMPSELCGPHAVTLTEPNGYLRSGISVNHTTGLQPYPPNQKCRWEIRYPEAKFIEFSVGYLSVTAGENLKVCNLEHPTNCYKVQSDTKQFKIPGSTASVEFSTGKQVPLRSKGWEFTYSAGLCDGKEDIYDHEGIIDYTAPTGFPYTQGLKCSWILHGKPGTLVSLSFTRINTSKELDLVIIYENTKDETFSEVANFSGLFSTPELPDTMNLTGKVKIIFTTKTDNGNGWSASFHISHPAKPYKSQRLIASAAIFISTSLVLVTLTSYIHRRRFMNRSADEKLMLVKVKVHKENCIGEGLSAIVYRAFLEDGSEVAVKYHKETQVGTSLEEEILLKVSSHPNIISLVRRSQDGFGRDLLVFEFMSRGTLSWNLRERGGIIDWEKRLAIALQISSALQKLHMCSKPPIYHGNLVSNNVLLDESWNAKLGGFGSAKYCRIDEWDSGDQIEMDEDIVNLGIILVELLRGDISPCISSPDFPRYFDEVNLILGGKDCLDRRLDFPQEENKMLGLTKLSDVAKWCIGASRIRGENSRPNIADVLLGLEQVKQLFR